MHKKIYYLHNNHRRINMEKNQYKDIVNKHTPKENRLFNGMIAFISGGLMGALGQLLIEFYLPLIYC